MRGERNVKEKIMSRRIFCYAVGGGKKGFAADIGRSGRGVIN